MCRKTDQAKVRLNLFSRNAFTDCKFEKNFDGISVKSGPYGGWRMADGGWRMADGGWRMADGGWRIEK